MGLRKTFADLPAKRRLIIIVVIGLGLATLCLMSYKYPNRDVAVSRQQVTEYTASDAVLIQPTMPKGYYNGVVTRDPFSLPPSVTGPQPRTPESSNSRSYQPAPTAKATQAKSDKPEQNNSIRLNGVVAVDGTRYAVISSGGKTKEYRVNQPIGSYTVRSINEDSVTLTGPLGQRILKLDTGKQGGSK